VSLVVAFAGLDEISVNRPFHAEYFDNAMDGQVETLNVVVEVLDYAG